MNRRLKLLAYFIGISSHCKSCALTLLGRTLFLILSHLRHKLGGPKVVNMAHTRLWQRPQEQDISATRYTHHKSSCSNKRATQLSSNSAAQLRKRREQRKSCCSGSHVHCVVRVSISIHLELALTVIGRHCFPPFFEKSKKKKVGEWRSSLPSSLPSIGEGIFGGGLQDSANFLHVVRALSPVFSWMKYTHQGKEGDE